jgi:hypothetical protein
MATTTSVPGTTSNPSYHKSLAIGLGVGIPLGIVLLGILMFLAFELRRYNNIRSTTTGGVQAAEIPQAVWETRHELPQQNL